MLPKEKKIDSLLTETSQAVGGLGPALQRLVDSTTNIAQGFKDNLPQVNDIIAHSAPILDSQVRSGDNIEQWARNLNVLASQSAQQDAALRSGLQQAPPTLDQVSAVFGDVRETLPPQTLANVEVVADMLKRYNKGLEQTLVILPQAAAAAQTASGIDPSGGRLDLSLTLNQPPPCLTGFLPASEWRSPADTSTAPPALGGALLQDPQGLPGNVVRGARNYPCVDVPGKRAASPKECRSNEPYVPQGTNPWYGDPNQILSCPAPGARCDQGVDPGRVVPAPTINNGMNPLPADQLPPPERNSNMVTSDPITPPPPGLGVVQWTATQPVRLHSSTEPAGLPSRIQSDSRRGRRTRRHQIQCHELDQPRRRRMEGDAGTSRLNSSDAESRAAAASIDRDTGTDAQDAGRRPSRLGWGHRRGTCRPAAGRDRRTGRGRLPCEPCERLRSRYQFERRSRAGSGERLCGRHAGAGHGRHDG